MGNRLLTILVLWGLLTFLPVGFGQSLAHAGNGFVTITILTVNDFHGALLQENKNPGAIRMAHYLKDEFVLNPEGTLIVSAGDMFQGTIDSDLLQGETVVAVMNNVGFDAMAVGNHEFDWGVETLRERVRQSRFPYLAANIFEKSTNKRPDFVKPYIILERKGVKIAIIGISTPETAYKAHPKFVSPYRFADPARTVNALLPEMKRQGAQMVVVLSHLGCEFDKQTNSLQGEAAYLANRISGVAALITGHSHTKLAGSVNGIPIIQAAYNGRAVGKVNLVYSTEDKKVISAVANVADIPLDGLAGDMEVSRIIGQAQVQTAPLKRLMVGEAKTKITHDRNELSLLGQWATDVMREAGKADIAFQNGGGLRPAVLFGSITKAQLYEMMPFDNTLFVMEMTGAEVLKVLEYGIHNSRIGTVQFSGLKVIYDQSQPAGKRVIQALLNTGKKLEKSKYYKVATNDFMAAGGDGFTMFSAGRNAVDTHLPIRQMLEQAIVKAKQLDIQKDSRLELR